MARAQETYGKKEREKKRLKKREIKAKKKAERQSNAVTGMTLEDQLVYVDENGHFTDTPPDPTKKVKVDAESIVLGIPKERRARRRRSDQKCYGQSPSCTALSLPANGTIDVPLDVDFEWIILTLEMLTMFDLPVNLPASSTVYVTIVTSNASGENTNCAEISFTTVATISALECSELLIPIKGAVDVPLNTILEWTASPGATGYRITIGSSIWQQ
ncbi:hypothetical protein GQR58_030590 [Nymphon striatum]|nr:hypothetical protein GQR58_030590 [Nymphon striatum]